MMSRIRFFNKKGHFSSSYFIKQLTITLGLLLTTRLTSSTPAHPSDVDRSLGHLLG